MTDRPERRPAGEIYADLRRETISWALALSPADRGRLVPLCPEWTVTQTVAHVVGIADDLLAGRLEGLGSDRWTAAQVDARSGWSLERICEEWEGLGPAIDAFTAADDVFGMRMTADLVTHVHDMAAAVGASVDRDTEAVRLGLERYGPFFCERAHHAGLPVVRVEASSGQHWQSAEGTVTAVVRGSDFELLRAFSGRRSAAQVVAMDWDGDPAPYLAVVTPYGLPSDDVEE